MKKFLLTLTLFLTSCTIFSNPETAGKFPVYGNYCGPDHPKEGATPTPIDMTDFSCKEHDACYEEKGYFYASCDEELINNLKRITPQTKQEEVARKLIISYFKRSPKIQ